MKIPENIHFQTEDQSYKEEVLAFIENWLDDSDYINVFTSGSTGKPKKIKISKQAMRVSAAKTVDYFSLTKGDTAALVLSIHTIAGKMMIVRSLLAGLELYVFSPTSKILENWCLKIDFCAVVPLQLENAIEANTISKIKHVLVGGAPVSFQLEQKLKGEKLTVYQSFGMTETLSHIAIRKIGLEEQKAYQAMKNVTFSTENDALIIHAPDLLDAPLYTNDIVELISPTAFIWKGRKDFVINSGGLKLHPEELEKKLSLHLDCPFFIASKPDEKWGESVVIVVDSEPKNSLNKVFFASKLSKFEIPKQIAFTTFVRTSSDKINRIATLNQIQESDWKTL